MPLIRGAQISGSVASASYALTASYALNSSGTGFPFSGSAVITGSLVVTGGITGSMNITNLSSGSYTQSFTNQSTWTVQHNLNSAYVVVQTYDTNEELMLPQTIDLTDANTTTISFPVALSGTAVVVVGTPLAGNGGGGNTAVSASYATNADLLDGKDSSVFAITGSNVFKGNQEITGSVTMSGGLSVGANNILIDGDAAFPFVVGYGANATNNKNNTALGYFSLVYNTTGTGNVSLGGGALTNNTTGNDNTAVGSNALVSNNTGYSNVAVGYGAQSQASSPALNVAVGYQALFLGGANNVAVGYQAGRFATSTSQRNVYLGYAAGPTASLNESDKLYIANSGGVPLIGGDFSTHEVTIDGSVTVSGSVNNASYIDFDTNAIATQPTPGRLSWNNTDGTLDLGLSGNNVTLQIGQEQLVRVVNKTNANLLESEYKVVRVRSKNEGGAQGQRLAVVLAQANNDPNSVDTLGLVTEDINNNQEGFITTSGLVRNINTTATGPYGESWSDGDVLYLSPTIPGALTNIKPVAPNHTVILGYVLYAHQTNGKIYVKVDNGYEIDELHNVRITTGSLTSGDLLSYTSESGYWQNSKQLTGSYAITGSLTATSLTGSLQGNASTATTASYIQTKTIFNQSVLGTGNIGFVSRSFTQSIGSNATGETQLLQMAIPANTFSTTDKIMFFAMFSKTGTANNTTHRIKISTSSSMPTGTTDQIAQYASTNTILFTKINRELVVQGGFIKSYPTTTSAVTDPGQSTTAMATTAFDVTQTQYIYVSATPSGGTTTDVTYLEAFEIRNY